MMKSLARCASMLPLASEFLTAKSRMSLIFSGENQISVSAFVCCGAVFASHLFDTKDERII